MQGYAERFEPNDERIPGAGRSRYAHNDRQRRYAVAGAAGWTAGWAATARRLRDNEGRHHHWLAR